MKGDDAAIHARVIARKAARLAKSVGLPVSAVRVNESVTDKKHTLTISVTIDATTVVE